jgi:Homeodomain-like domain
MALPNKPPQHSDGPKAGGGAAARATDRSNGKAAKKGVAAPELAASGTGRSNRVEYGEPTEPTAAPSAVETTLAIVLDMRVEGRSQAQVAAYFGVSERTVRRWEREAMRRGITPLRDREPFEFPRERLNDLAEFRADLLALYRAARDAKDHSSLIKWLKMLSHVRQE